MIQKLLYFAIGLFCVSLSAQQPSHYPIKSGSVWRINYEYCCGEEFWAHQNGDEEYKYFVDGDTVIGTRTYYKLFKTGILYLDTPFRIEHKYICAIRDSADMFYTVTKDEPHESLLYNFGAGVGEIMQPDGFPVDEIDTLDNGRKSYYFGIISVHCGSANTIIEGIGWLGGLLEGNSCSGHPGVRGSYLVCYTENGEVIYQTDHVKGNNPAQCNLNFTSTINRSVSNEIKVFVLPEKMLKLQIPDKYSGDWDLEIYSASGTRIKAMKYKEKDLVDIRGINTGVYILRLSNQEISIPVKFIVD